MRFFFTKNAHMGICRCIFVEEEIDIDVKEPEDCYIFNFYTQQHIYHIHMLHMYIICR